MTTIDDDLIIDSFVQIFRGRGDVYGNSKGYCVHERLDRDVFEKHLRSTDPSHHIGVYCMMETWCSWGCIDIDGKDFAIATPCDNCGEFCDDEPCRIDNVPYGPGTEWDWHRMQQLAVNLQTLLAAKEIHAHIEQSKNGYHLWVFPFDPVPAADMRRALMAACVALGYSPKEVNPKAEGPRPGTQGLGNFVRLPYGGWLTTRVRPTQRMFVSPHFTALNLDYALAHIHRTTAASLAATAKLWTPPPPPSTEIDFDAGLEVEPILPLLDGKTWTVWHDGPLPGSDRTTTLAKLAHLCAERGITATMAFAVVKSADARWGKFSTRADCDEQLARFIEGAYE